LNISATAVAFLGVSVLLVSGVLKWKDMAANKLAWQTLIFFGILVGMASQLNTLGVIDWIGSFLSGSVSGFSWSVVLVVLSILYFIFCCTTCLPQSSPK
jgi:DASS family divalent anion:Na+ symporter